jgi:very-short-patch-repair endonuclease
MAAVFAGGAGAVLSHRSAGQAWRLVRGGLMPIEITRSTGWRAPAGILAHRCSLPLDEVTILDSIPVTSVSRTILDLAAALDRRQVERVINEAHVLGLTDRLSVPDLLGRYPRRRGTAILRALLGDEAALRGITRSELEERFLALLDAHELPSPRLNADLLVRGRFVNVDCLWADAQVIVELDRRAVHDTARAFERDRERDRLFLLDGWRVTRLTWRQLRDHPDRIVADLRELLGRSAASTL